MKSRARIILIVMLLLFVSTNSASALKNPSGVYCKELGYEYITATMPDGGQRGFCILPDDQIVDAWEFLEGKVGQEYSYCEKEGYEIKTVADSEACSRIFTYECAVCILEDGTEVEVTELMNLSFIESVCGDGICGLPENFETCPEDCPSGELDEYCDGLADRICDPDCEEKDDPDCEEEFEISWSIIISVIFVIILAIVFIFLYRKEVSR